jgi:hypothetical protein
MVVTTGLRSVVLSGSTSNSDMSPLGVHVVQMCILVEVPCRTLPTSCGTLTTSCKSCAVSGRTFEVSRRTWGDSSRKETGK